MVKQKKTGTAGKKQQTTPSKKKRPGGAKKKHELKAAGDSTCKKHEKQSNEDRQRSYEHHDHCHKVQKKPTHTVTMKPSKFDNIGAMMAAEDILRKKEMRHHREVHRTNQPGLAH